MQRDQQAAHLVTQHTNSTILQLAGLVQGAFTSILNEVDSLANREVKVTVHIEQHQQRTGSSPVAVAALAQSVAAPSSTLPRQLLGLPTTAAIASSSSPLVPALAPVSPFPSAAPLLASASTTSSALVLASSTPAVITPPSPSPPARALTVALTPYRCASFVSRCL
ncbi:hypothetical protein A4X06_0g9768 [Tilletia controversa]|uniref:Uncharacterized protein n=1 Tax=Tilletia controversa TaxID=13291 RepID=A0A8X7SRY7_9BASI|nr:hypothetical protein A4X06_0g9768 [Tilletia controversa]